ncbi:type II toxin-antitoxin system RelE/ParE family toxin [Citreicella sp. C3M06]|uniref:type II toxin-antitoxin system RelE/ParE family toxin n=1 Tax=Citreicella sp. C3M06 TaxID=2841564 RepID=UPI001C090128|nr:type II toxin-antitoxin system RelE/ParE family toxin [Citreicella sp. C3M06]MBU2960476.1 type II toxin-antitoxin system RelE/ParE family toxin [Citreicella sp. C3M06]
MQCVIETHAFVSAAKDAGLSEEERHKVVTFIAENPATGDVIKGTGGARKVRFPLRNKGKSGGVRVITFYSGEDIPVFLLDVFSKGERIDVSQSERNEMKKILGEMAESYRAAHRVKIADLVEKTG